jgi:hypothetical protein
LIAAIERRTLWSGRKNRDPEQLPKSPVRPTLWRLSRGFSVHGELQSVFDAEPPQSIEQAIANEDDLGHHNPDDEFAEAELGPDITTKRPRTNTASRRDSVAPFAGITGRLRDILLDESDDGDKDVAVKERLEALEEATVRIERMLGRLCKELDDSSRSGFKGKETGTIADLDVSGTADIDE